MSNLSLIENRQGRDATPFASAALSGVRALPRSGRDSAPSLSASPSRVYLREHTMADCGPFCDWQTDPEVMKYSDQLVRSRQEALARLAESIAQQAAAERQKYFLAVVLKENDEVIGDVGITLNDRGTGDMGWFLRRPFWGKGYATEAVRQLIDYSLGELGLLRIFASCHRENKASERIMIKCGFKFFTSSPNRVFYFLDRPSHL